jgi:hypothetical protein
MEKSYFSLKVITRSIERLGLSDRPSKIGLLGLTILLFSCNNPTPKTSPQVVVVATPPSTETTPVASDPLFTSQPFSSGSSVTPTPESQDSPSPSNANNTPIITEGKPQIAISPNPGQPQIPSLALQIESEIKSSITTEYNIDINSLKCPNIAATTKGQKTVCRVVTPNGNFSVNLTNNGQQYEYETQGIVLLRQVESKIETDLQKNRSLSVDATCNGEVLIFNIGDYLNCQVKNADGTSQSVAVTFSSLNGNTINVRVLDENSQPANNKPPQNVPFLAAKQNSDKLEKRLRTLLAQEMSTNIQSVTCPEKVEKQFNKSYACQAMSGRGSFSIEVKLTNPKGGFKYQAKGVVLPKKLGETIAKEVEGSTGKRVSVDCGETAIVFQPGAVIGCQLETGKGEPQNIKVTIQDEYGKKVKVNYRLTG